MSDWAIPQQARLKYTQLFNLHDRVRSGFLSGLQCRDILTQSGLPRNVLAEIWNLSDIDGDGQLTREEFILAMHLTNQVRAGQTLPNQLPQDLIPPSYRKIRNSSVTSIQSNLINAPIGAPVSNNDDNESNITITPTSSASPSIAAVSVLNTDSFENKRRENFEKGRAELEKRRLKVLEQQTAIVRDQLEAKRKEVAEAKSKIDSMRIDRDNRMGIITTLEANIQSVRDRKLQLLNEEQTLNAIELDLKQKEEIKKQAKELEMTVKQLSVDPFKGTNTSKNEDPFKQEDPFQQEDPFKQDDPFKENDPFKGYGNPNQNNNFEQKDPFNQEDRFKREDPFQQEDPFAQEDPFNKGAPFEEGSSNTTSIGFDPNNRTSMINSPKVDNQTAKDGTIQSNDNESTLGGIDLNVKQHDQDSLRHPSEFDTSSNLPDVDPFKQDDPFKDADPFKDEKSGQLRKKYRTIYQFEARNVDELNINPGDLIDGIEGQYEPGWLMGEIDDRKGLFPEAYVEKLPDQIQDSSKPVQISQKASPVATSSEPSQICKRYKTLYQFEARNVDELTINPGDLIDGIEGTYEPGWLMGKLNGRRGLFPEAYVERLPDHVQESSEPGQLQRMSSVGSLKSKKSRQKKHDIAQVIANYKALGQEQINLEKGQLVIVRRKMDSGWWEGEIQLKGKKNLFGWFPASYVKLLSNNPSPAV